MVERNLESELAGLSGREIFMRISRGRSTEPAYTTDSTDCSSGDPGREARPESLYGDTADRPSLVGTPGPWEICSEADRAYANELRMYAGLKPIK
jgi:hypothetical protein